MRNQRKEGLYFCVVLLKTSEAVWKKCLQLSDFCALIMSLAAAFLTPAAEVLNVSKESPKEESQSSLLGVGCRSKKSECVLRKVVT